MVNYSPEDDESFARLPMPDASSVPQAAPAYDSYPSDERADAHPVPAVLGATAAGDSVERPTVPTEKPETEATDQPALYTALSSVLTEVESGLSGRSVGIGRSLKGYIEANHASLSTEQADDLFRRAHNLQPAEDETHATELEVMTGASKNTVAVAEHLGALQRQLQRGEPITAKDLEDVYAYVRKVHVGIQMAATPIVEKENMLLDLEGRPPLGPGTPLLAQLPPIDRI